MQTATEALASFVAGLGVKGKAELDALIAPELAKPWLPTPGPQLDAYLSPADLLLYGGAAGGGKSDLLLGLATCDAERAVLFRRQFVDLRGLEERLIEIVGPDGYNRSDKVWRQPGHLVEMGHLDRPGSELSWQGRPHDFIGFDEGAQNAAAKVNFVLGWLRSTSGKRCRAVIGSNPPIGGEGAWLIEWFAPWLDPLFPNPAKPGELRWAVTLGKGDEITTRWVESSSPVVIEGETYLPLSRTYIPSRLDDNPYLRDTNYRAQINAMPEPLRSQLLYGDFLAGRTDDPWQVIPSAWVRAAQERWDANKDKVLPPMLHMGVDVAQGGADTTVVAPLRGVRFDPLTEVPGKDTPDPVSVVQLIVGLRRNDAGITVDCTGGWGGGVVSHLKTHNEIYAVSFVASEGSGATDKSGKLLMLNRRSEVWWKFRESLDPANDEKIELPPDTKLAAQLTAPHWKLKGAKIQVESKDDIRERLGSSTDRADAVITAWADRGKTLMRRAYQKGESSWAEPVADPFDDF